MSAIWTNTYVETNVLFASWARLHYGQCILSVSWVSTIRCIAFSHPSPRTPRRLGGYGRRATPFATSLPNLAYQRGRLDSREVVLARERLVMPGPRGLLSGISLHFSDYATLQELGDLRSVYRSQPNDANSISWRRNLGTEMIQSKQHQSDPMMRIRERSLTNPE